MDSPPDDMAVFWGLDLMPAILIRFQELLPPVADVIAFEGPQRPVHKMLSEAVVYSRERDRLMGDVFAMLLSIMSQPGRSWAQQINDLRADLEATAKAAMTAILEGRASPDEV